MTARAQQKQQTRRTIVRAALDGLNADRSFGSLSLREVARNAGIAPTSFYRHFKDMDDLGVNLVSESAIVLKELMQKKILVQASDNFVKGSLDIFLSALSSHPQEFRFVMRESSGNSKNIRESIKNLTTAFSYELASFLEVESKRRGRKIHNPLMVSQMVVALIFHIGREFLDAQESEKAELYQKAIEQMNFMATSTELMAEKKLNESKPGQQRPTDSSLNL